MFSKRRYKICIFLVILGALVFAKLQALRASEVFPENFSCNLTLYASQNFSNSSLHYIFVTERKGHLQIISCPQAKENSRQYLLLRTDNSQKTVVGCP